MIDAAPDARLRAFVAVLGYTGCRISEAMGIEWSDVNDERIVIRNGKGDKSRAVPMTPTLAEILREWRKQQAAERLRAIWWDTEHDYVPSSDCGTYWDHTTPASGSSRSRTALPATTRRRPAPPSAPARHRTACGTPRPRCYLRRVCR